VKRVKVKKCPHCGSFELGKWTNKSMTIDDLANTIISKMFDVGDLKYELKGNEPNYRVKFSGKDNTDGKDVKGDFSIIISSSTCPACTKKLGNYYEAVLQIRGGTEETAKAATDFSVKSVEEQGSSDIFITKVLKIKEGYDLYLSNKQYARATGKQLTDKFGGSYKETSHLVGRKNGTDLYRITISIRIPGFQPGDIIKLNGRIYEIEGIRRNKVMLFDLVMKTQEIFKLSEIEDYMLWKRERTVKEADVIYREGNTAYILDPSDFKEKAVIDSRKAKTIKIARVDDEIYVLPDKS
jgi:nonsense-mediated mRNA decay protein 3